MKNLHNVLGWTYYTIAGLLFGFTIGSLVILSFDAFGKVGLVVAILVLIAAYLFWLHDHKPDEGPLDYEND